MALHNAQRQPGSAQLRGGGYHGVRAVLLLSFYLAIFGLQLCSNSAAQTLAPVQTFSTNANKIATDGTYVIVGYIDVQVWRNNVNNGTKYRDIATGYTEPIVALAALDGFVYTVTTNGPKSIRKWNYTNSVVQWRAPRFGNSHDDVLTSMVVSSSGVYTSSLDGTIKQWSLNDGLLISTLQPSIAPSGFVAPVQKLFVDRTEGRLYAVFGRYKALDDVERATLLPSGDFEDITSEQIMRAYAVLGNWKTQPIHNETLVIHENYAGGFAPSGYYFTNLRTNQNSSSLVRFIQQTISVTPGNTYQLRYWYRGANPYLLPLNNTLKINGNPVDINYDSGTANHKWYQAVSAEFLATGKSCIVEIATDGCDTEICYFYVDFIELVLVHRKENIDNMQLSPTVYEGTFEIVDTSTNVTITGSIDSWARGGGSGTVAIAKVGSNNCYNLPSAGGNYALWMSTATDDDTTVYQNIQYMQPGYAYMIRWHMAMRHVRYTSTENLVSSSLNVSFCGSVVAANVTAPSLLFEELSSSIITPIGTGWISCTLQFTILRGPATLQSLLIDEVELVIVHNTHLGPSGRFEGLTDTTTSWSNYPGGMMGGWISSGHSSGHAAIARIPSTECDNARSIASPYVLWLQSSTSAPAVSMSISINTFVTGLHYLIRWSYARRKQGVTVFTAPSLFVSVFGITVSSARNPSSEVFTATESDTFIASGTTTTLTLSVSLETTTSHMLIDDVEVVLIKEDIIAASSPIVNEYIIDQFSMSPLRNYTMPSAWMSTLAVGTVAEFAALSVSNGILYAGMSLSSLGSVCHVLKYNTVNGDYIGPLSVTCNGGSVSSMTLATGQLLVGYTSAVSQIALLVGESLVRTLSWTFGSTPIVDLAAGGWYLFANGNDSQALKWRLPEWVPTTTTTTSTTSTLTTSTTTTSTSTTSTWTPTMATTTRALDGGTPVPGSGAMSARTIKIIIGAVAILLIAAGMVVGTIARRRNRRPNRNRYLQRPNSTGQPLITLTNTPSFCGGHSGTYKAVTVGNNPQQTSRPWDVSNRNGAAGHPPLGMPQLTIVSRTTGTNGHMDRYGRVNTNRPGIEFSPSGRSVAMRDRRRSFQPNYTPRSGIREELPHVQQGAPLYAPPGPNFLTPMGGAGAEEYGGQFARGPSPDGSGYAPQEERRTHDPSVRSPPELYTGYSSS